MASSAHPCWELHAAPADSAAAGAGLCKAAVTFSAAVLWSTCVFLPCEPGEEEAGEQHCSCLAALL